MSFQLKTVSKPAAAAATDTTAQSAAKPQGFLKTGGAAVALMNKSAAETKARQEQAGKAYRFWLKVGDDAHITFLDGRIDPNTGILDIPYANEHRIKVGDKWQDFICTEDHEACPLCAAGERKTFVGYLSIIDHRGYTTEKDGKTVTVEACRRLYVAKTETLKQLTKMAEKREDGLVGVTYEVSRTGDKKAAVGDLFDRVGEHSMPDIKEAFPEFGEPLNYNEELPYLTADELTALGIGKKVATIGSKSFGGTKSEEVDEDKPVW
jgi:hypothetical protein